MELTLAAVAQRYGCTTRTVQLAVHGGQLSASRQIGRTLLVDDLAAQAWHRATARGRRWTDRVCEAALDLLSDGMTSAVNGSERARLRARLRAMTARQIAHASGGLGNWARYDGARTAKVRSIGPSAVTMADLGLVGGDGWVQFGQVDDLDAFELETDVRLSANGDLGVVERSRLDDRLARVLLDTYLLGDARASALAGTRLEELARAL